MHPQPIPTKDGPFVRGWFRTPASAAMLLGVAESLAHWMPHVLNYTQLSNSYFIWPVIGCFFALSIPYQVFRNRTQLRYAVRLTPLFAYAHFIPDLMLCHTLGYNHYIKWEDWISPIHSLCVAPLLGLALATLYGIPNKKRACTMAAVKLLPLLLLMCAIRFMLGKSMGKDSADYLITLLMLYMASNVAFHALLHGQIEKILRIEYANRGSADESQNPTYPINLESHYHSACLGLVIMLLIALSKMRMILEVAFVIFQMSVLGGVALLKKGRRDQGWIAVTFFTTLVLTAFVFGPKLASYQTQIADYFIYLKVLSYLAAGIIVGWFYSRWYRIPKIWECMKCGCVGHFIVGVQYLITYQVIGSQYPWTMNVPVALWIEYTYWFIGWAGSSLLTLWLIKHSEQIQSPTAAKVSPETYQSAG